MTSVISEDYLRLCRESTLLPLHNACLPLFRIQVVVVYKYFQFYPYFCVKVSLYMCYFSCVLAKYVQSGVLGIFHMLFVHFDIKVNCHNFSLEYSFALVQFSHCKGQCGIFLYLMRSVFHIPSAQYSRTTESSHTSLPLNKFSSFHDQHLVLPCSLLLTSSSWLLTFFI